MALHEHGLTDVLEVKLAVLEGDGMISVVPLDASKVGHRRPRARIVRRISDRLPPVRPRRVAVGRADSLRTRA